MLDQAIKSIENGIQIRSITHQALILTDFFSAHDSELILKSLSETSSNWKAVSLQEDKPRLSLEDYSDSVLKQANELFGSEQIILAVSQIFKLKLEFKGVSFWKDKEGYEIDMHVDNESYNCAFQIYLSKATYLNLGTSFSLDKEQATMLHLPYRNASGYFLASANRTVHGLLTPVPKGVERFSIYARYNKIDL